MRTVWRIILGAMAWLSASAIMADGRTWTRADEMACRDDKAGKFKFYVLSLSWSPEFCRSHPDQQNNRQCRGDWQFIAHGLWPRCASDESPEYCRNSGTADRIDKQEIYPFMPSDYLIEHEWTKHGTCSGLRRSEYFELTGKLFGKLKLPSLSGAPTPDQIEQFFIDANPGLDRDEIVLSCTESGAKSSSKTLDEIRICLDRDTHGFVRCENMPDTCRKLGRVSVTPAR